MWRFVKHFFKNIKQTGAIMPSGKELAEAMVAPIDFSKTTHIVEIGAGTGAFTKKILSKMKKESALTIVEINKEFCNELRKIKDKRLKIIEGNALHLSSAVKKADYVVSGLPLVNFSKQEQQKIFHEIQKVSERYVQFHYSPLAEKEIKQHFEILNKKRVLKNVPPAIVYSCKRKV
jgi:phospholipid N-methyltransferase